MLDNLLIDVQPLIDIGDLFEKLALILGVEIPSMNFEPINFNYLINMIWWTARYGQYM